jgi:hypothetical protein
MEDIIDRIKSHVRVHTDSEVAERIGLRKQELFQYKKKKTIPYKYLIEWARMESVSLDWLLMGREQVADSEYKEKYINQLEKDNERLVNENQMLMSVIERLSEGQIASQEAKVILEQICN